MSMMIALRLLHILAGVFWAGTALFAASFLLPAVRASGPAGGQIMGQLVARGYPIFIAITAFTTVLSGAGMYALNVSMSAGAFARSRAGMAYGIGGLAGVIALVIAAGVVSRTGAKLGGISGAAQARGGPPSAEEASEMARLQGRMQTATQLVALFVTIALIAMAIARYV